ncbi:Histone-arginine methyltransferase CARM1 [Acipenser ruthenus]|uniref:Histone-arginine methyltransferase CARM1 n=1 Tax=Acipenser ruthenus TaxID=7906 RepID=A0A444UTP8_ACIRT|nr:Histone-arginine methyltransferase CARM1 [Acipenser ruthenus]
MFPTIGDVHLAPFTDEQLYMEQFTKANFWYQPSFHGVDLSALRGAAVDEYFRQPIVSTSWRQKRMTCTVLLPQLNMLLYQCQKYQRCAQACRAARLHAVISAHVCLSSRSSFSHPCTVCGRPPGGAILPLESGAAGRGLVPRGGVWCRGAGIEIPFKFHMMHSGLVHGLAFWFDVAFIGSVVTVWLSTAPTEPLTHWYQVRCLLQSPLFAKAGDTLSGTALLLANKRQSYDISIVAQVDQTGSKSSNLLDLKNPFFRYTGATPSPPPGSHYTSPSENMWNTGGGYGMSQVDLLHS